jgi:ABC-type lipoprotein release transport system permease subunit
VVLVGTAAVASLVATFWPARQASHIRPAVALRIAE